MVSFGGLSNRKPEDMGRDTAKFTPTNDVGSHRLSWQGGTLGGQQQSSDDDVTLTAQPRVKAWN